MYRDNRSWTIFLYLFKDFFFLHANLNTLVIALDDKHFPELAANQELA
jgi:hypothetical protein